jgi:hypothetical protein
MAICPLQSGHSTQHLWVSFLATIWSNRAPPLDQMLSVTNGRYGASQIHLNERPVAVVAQRLFQAVYAEPGMGSQEVLLAEVDKALYAAKSNGRNRLATVVDGQSRVLKFSQQLCREQSPQTSLMAAAG